MDMIHRVALYARFSSDQQRQESLDAQLRAMKAYCKEKHYLIVKTYTDSARSGTNDKRQGFQDMIADSVKKEFDIVLVHKLDRFARNRFDSAYYRRKLKQNGVTVYSVLENLNDSPESVILESLLEGMSEYYSKNLSREVLKGLKENALKCQHTGGHPPIGYSVDENKMLVINEAEAPIIRLIFDLYDRGFQYSYILKKLSEQGYKSRRGNDFSRSSLYETLHNEKYCGVYIYSKTASKSANGKRNGHKYKPNDEIIRIEDGIPAIVSKKQFLRVAKRLEINASMNTGAKGKQHYLLRSKVVCGICGQRMNGSSRYSGNKKYYHSTYRCSKIKQLCGNREINRLYLEKWVDEYFSDTFFTLENLTNIRKAYDDSYSERIAKQEDEVQDLSRQLDSVDAQIKKVVEFVENGVINDIIFDKLTGLNEQKNDLESKLDSLTKYTSAELDWTPEEVMQDYSSAAFGSDEYRVILQRFIKEIRVMPYSVTMTLKVGDLNDSEIPMALDDISLLTITRKELYEKYGSRVTKAFENNKGA